MYQKNNLMPSNKKFGFFFGLIFLIVSSYFFYYSNKNYYLLFLILSIIITLITLFASDYLYYLNFLWFKLGLLLNKIVSPLILGIIFFILITPVALIAKLFGRDELRINKKNIDTFWTKSVSRNLKPDYFWQQY